MSAVSTRDAQTSDALAKAREQLERARERVKQLEAKEAAKERKRDTRRKILLGALLMERMGRHGEEAQRLKAWVQRELPGFLTRDHDKEIFKGWNGVTVEVGEEGSEV